MPDPYSHDLRLRVMGAVESGMTYEKEAHRSRVSNSSILNWVRRQRETGSYAALPMSGQKPFALADELDWLRSRLAAKQDLTLRELLAKLCGRGIEVNSFALWNMVRRAGLTLRKDRSRQRAGPVRCCP